MLTVKGARPRLALMGTARADDAVVREDRRLDGLTRDWLAGLGSSNTRDAYGRDLASFRIWCEGHGRAPLEAGAAEIDSYRDACDDEGAGRATIARRLSALSSFFDHAVSAAAVRVNPVVGVDRPPPRARPTGTGPVSLDRAESAALFEAAVDLGPKVGTLVALLLWDGLKLGEALALDVARLDGRGRSLRATVLRRRAAVVVPLDERSARAIERYLCGREDGPLLLGESPTHGTGSRLTRFGADFLLKQAARHAGLERPVSANTLRRTYIADAHRRGSSVEDIQRQVGHRNTRDTRRYLT